MTQAFRGQVRVAAEHQRAGVPVGDKTAVEIAKIRKNLAKNADSLQGLLEREENIRADFEKQLVRYRYLIENWDEESSDS